MPTATFWADECVDNRVKVNEEMEDESKMAVQFIRRFYVFIFPLCCMLLEVFLTEMVIE